MDKAYPERQGGSMARGKYGKGQYGKGQDQLGREQVGKGAVWQGGSFFFFLNLKLVRGGFPAHKRPQLRTVAPYPSSWIHSKRGLKVASSALAALALRFARLARCLEHNKLSVPVY